MSRAASFINRVGESATLYTRSLGARDPTTGWPAVSWSSSSIKVMTKFLSSREVDTPAGRVTEERRMFYFTEDAGGTPPLP